MPGVMGVVCGNGGVLKGEPGGVSGKRGVMGELKGGPQGFLGKRGVRGHGQLKGGPRGLLGKGCQTNRVPGEILGMSGVVLPNEYLFKKGFVYVCGLAFQF